LVLIVVRHDSGMPVQVHWCLDGKAQARDAESFSSQKGAMSFALDAGHVGQSLDRT
jgi:hypothetical protein